MDELDNGTAENTDTVRWWRNN